MINPNPKNDALLVLVIMIKNSKEEFNKMWVLEKITQIKKHKEPFKLLVGKDYTEFMRIKNQKQYTHEGQ